MASSEDQETLRLLVQHVSRAFYEPRFVVILDQLCQREVLKEDELVERVGMPNKELQKLVAKLNADKLVQVYRRNEIQREGQRPVNKQYYYLDFKKFCDVVKWRITTMRNDIDQKLRNELDNKGFVCPNCKKSFMHLDVAHLSLSPNAVFQCDVCRTELIDNENAASVQGSKDRMQRFMAQTKWIQEDLQRTDSITIPALNVEKWLREQQAYKNAENGIDVGDGLMIAGEGGSTSRLQRVQIEMSLDQDDDNIKKARAQEADAMRQQNALPDWHTRSTVSGELTSLGLANAAHSSNPQFTAPRPNGEADTKPGPKDLYASDIDRYYASLNASAAASGEQTPVEDEEEDDFEEVGFHPTMPDGPVTNGNGKRPRDEQVNGRPSKLARIDGGSVSSGSARLPSAPDMAVAGAEEDDDDDFEEVDVS